MATIVGINVFHANLLIEQARVREKLEEIHYARINELEGAEKGDRQEIMARYNALESKERKDLAEINNAIERCENGTYRKCRICGSEIPDPRHEAVPTASLCLPCQTRESCKQHGNNFHRVAIVA